MGAGCTRDAVPKYVPIQIKQEEESEVNQLRIKLRESEKELEEKKRELKIIYELDEIRDCYPEPRSLFTHLVRLLSERLQLSFICLYILDNEFGDLELWGTHCKGNELSKVSQRVNFNALYTWMERNYDTLTRTKEDAVVMIFKKKAPPPELRINIGESKSNHMVGVQIVLEGKKIGVLFFGRDFSFTPVEIEVIKAAESQIDSAIIQAQNFLDLQHRNKELEAIYAVDHIRDEDHPLDDFLDLTIGHLSNILQCEMSFVMLYDSASEKLRLQAVSHQSLWDPEKAAYIERFSRESLRGNSILWFNDLQNAPFKAFMCIPLVLKNQIIGVFGCANISSDRKFLSTDRRLLKAIASQMDTAIYDNLESFRLKQVLGRSVDGRVMERILATVLYADMRNSTVLAEKTETTLLGSYINEWLGQMAQVVISFQGTLDKFMGDEVMALFNVPFPQDDHALLAVQVGFKMQEVHGELMKVWRGKGVDTTPIGVGIATGELIVGEMGCSLRTDYTAIGRAANLGSRICEIAAGGSVMVSQETFNLIKQYVDATPVHGLSLKGIGANVTAYQINRILVAKS